MESENLRLHLWISGGPVRKERRNGALRPTAEERPRPIGCDDSRRLRAVGGRACATTAPSSPPPTRSVASPRATAPRSTTSSPTCPHLPMRVGCRRARIRGGPGRVDRLGGRLPALPARRFLRGPADRAGVAGPPALEGSRELPRADPARREHRLARARRRGARPVLGPGVPLRPDPPARGRRRGHEAGVRRRRDHRPAECVARRRRRTPDDRLGSTVPPCAACSPAGTTREASPPRSGSRVCPRRPSPRTSSSTSWRASRNRAAASDGREAVGQPSQRLSGARRAVGRM